MAFTPLEYKTLVLFLSPIGIAGFSLGAVICSRAISKRLERLDNLEKFCEKHQLPYKPSFFNLKGYERMYMPLIKEYNED